MVAGGTKGVANHFHLIEFLNQFLFTKQVQDGHKLIISCSNFKNKVDQTIILRLFLSQVGYNRNFMHIDQAEVSYRMSVLCHFSMSCYCF